MDCLSQQSSFDFASLKLTYLFSTPYSTHCSMLISYVLLSAKASTFCCSNCWSHHSKVACLTSPNLRSSSFRGHLAAESSHKDIHLDMMLLALVVQLDVLPFVGLILLRLKGPVIASSKLKLFRPTAQATVANTCTCVVHVASSLYPSQRDAEATGLGAAFASLTAITTVVRPALRRTLLPFATCTAASPPSRWLPSCCAGFRSQRGTACSSV